MSKYTRYMLLALCILIFVVISGGIVAVGLIHMLWSKERHLMRENEKQQRMDCEFWDIVDENQLDL